MGSEIDQLLRIFFFPLPTPGHMIPMVEEARVFAKHGVDVTIIRIHTFPFPSAEVGLPDGIENFNNITSMEMTRALAHALQLLRKPIEQLFHDMRPDCIVTDTFYPWTLDVANKLGIPRLGFRGSSYISLCAEYCIKKYETHKSTESDVVLIPGLPHNVEMMISKIPDWMITTKDFTHRMDFLRDCEQKSYGMLMNSFHDLENDFEDHFNSMGYKAWSIGPVSLWVNKDATHKADRYNINSGIDGAQGHEVIDWLNSKENNSVLYVGFGSLTKLPATQIDEIAHGLEASGHPFIWVVRKKDNVEYGEAFQEGFEERMKEIKRDYIIRGWAPQVLILDHPAIGGLVTHCGWNSVLEGVNAGLPMITWPMFAEQFYNEKLLIDVLRIGVAVGVKEWREWGEEGTAVVSRAQVEKAVRLLMGEGEEAAELRKRVRKLRDGAKKAVEIGGSSYNSLMALIDELKSLKINKGVQVV
nr:soyasapogenol B glucuronide galactosyltransferase-like isoform X2 [Ziziphus jujuba var. spinosa]